MKEQKVKVKSNLLKKIFIKVCRIFGFEIIDQSNFFVPTQEKKLNENLNIPGKKSITIPLGETKITRKISSLKIIFSGSKNSLTPKPSHELHAPRGLLKENNLGSSSLIEYPQ